MVIKPADYINQNKLAAHLRLLADRIDSGNVVVRSVARPNPVTTYDPITITWSPEISLLSAEGSHELLNSLNGIGK